MKYFPDLADKKVLVTGGSKGIGRDIALAFAEHGASVIISGRNEHDLEKTAKELKQFNQNCSFITADLMEVEQVYRMVDTAVNRLGSLDILVNNAGINIPKPTLTVTEEDWDRIVDTNLKASFFCSQRAATYMIPCKRGKIINIASQMSFVGYSGRAAYCSSKGGVVQLTKALAVEWAKDNILVNAVAPTFIVTELTAGMLQNDEFKNDVLSRIPLGRMAEPAHVTGAVLYLSSQLADMITGETLKVDGGWTAI